MDVIVSGDPPQNEPPPTRVKRIVDGPEPPGVVPKRNRYSLIDCNLNCKTDEDDYYAAPRNTTVWMQFDFGMDRVVMGARFYLNLANLKDSMGNKN